MKTGTAVEDSKLVHQMSNSLNAFDIRSLINGSTVWISNGWTIDGFSIIGNSISVPDFTP